MNSAPQKIKALKIKDRFRGFLPVIVDVETSGVNPETNALLEVCVVLIEQDDQGQYRPGLHYFEHVMPFEGAVMDELSLAFNQIDPYQPLRFAVDEKVALQQIFKPIQQAVSAASCQRAVLVGHNAWFDLLFIKAATQRSGLRSPFHAFTCFDNASRLGLWPNGTCQSHAGRGD